MMYANEYAMTVSYLPIKAQAFISYDPLVNHLRELSETSM